LFLDRSHGRTKATTPTTRGGGGGTDRTKKKVFCLLGHNGAGKSTTIAMLCGRARPSAGDAAVAGRSIREELSAVRARIALCPQVWNDGHRTTMVIEQRRS